MLLIALRSVGRLLKHARIQGFVEETVPLYYTSDFKRCIRICRGTFEQFSTFSSLATWDDHSRTRQNYPKRTHILPIPSKPYSVYSAHSAIGSRMNGIAFRSFRKRNRSQKNAIAVYSKYSYSGIVPKECAPSYSIECPVLLKNSLSHRTREQNFTSMLNSTPVLIQLKPHCF